MSTLIIYCPIKPSTTQSELWEEEDLYFLWGLSSQDLFQPTLDLETCPVTDQVIAIIPNIDIRITELKIPSVSTKKLIQVLPLLLEDELLSAPSSTYLRLLPPFPNQAKDHRMISIMDRDWLMWLSRRLASLYCERIQLIPESLVLPSSEDIIFHIQKDNNNFYTYKKNMANITSWVQAKGEKPIEILERSEPLQVVDISFSVLKNGITSEKNIYEYINLLPQEFQSFRRANHTEMQHWLSFELWREPLRWTSYFSLMILVCYLSYLFFIIWQDRQWQNALHQSTLQVLAHKTINQPTIPILIDSSCQAAHLNHETCTGDFERMLISLQEILKDSPPEALQSIEYSKKGLGFEFQGTLISRNQLHLNYFGSDSIQSIDASHYFIKPYANLNHE
jgi:hypothetical protein